MLKRNSTLVVCIVSIVASSLGQGIKIPEGPFEATWESLSRHEAAPKWFRDAKFGIYFHWGVYSVPAFGNEWYPRWMYTKGRSIYKHHVETYGPPEKFGYHDFIPMFKAEHFDPDAWAELFVKAGARYAGPVAEHHDGFSMWASKVNPWNAAAMGPRRDIVGELERAIRKRGMRFVATFHHAHNRGHYPRVKGWPTASTDPKLRILYGNLPDKQYYDLWLAKLVEVVDAYRPDIVWFDSWLNTIPEKYRLAFLAYYFNRAHQWGKAVVVTRKQNDLPLSLSVEDFEKGRANRLTRNVWLTDDTISRGSWCYTTNLRIKTTAEVLHSLIDIISKNGCLLLNISPKADGTIPQDQREVLLGIGEWLACCGEAVYETRPWVVFGEGPTRLKKGGHFVRSVRYTDKDVRFSTRGDTLYAIFLGIPKGKATIASLATNSGLCGGKVQKVTLLGSDRSLGFTRDAEGLHVEFPREVPCKHAVAIRIEGLKIEGFKPDLSARFKDGKLVLEAADAELHGPGIHTESKDAGRTSIGFWDDPSAYPAWEATFPTKGAYRVVARIAARAPSRFTVAVGRDTLACQVEATGDWDKFRDFTLGKIEVSEPGKKTIKVLPDKKAWKAINLSTLQFIAE